MKKSYNSAWNFAIDFAKSKKTYWTKAHDIEQQIEKLKKQKEKLFYPRLHEQLNRLAEAVRVELLADTFEVSVPGGMTNEVSIWFTKGKERLRRSNVVGYLCFADFGMDDCSVTLIDYKTKQRDVIDITSKMDAKYLAKLARRSEQF